MITTLYGNRGLQAALLLLVLIIAGLAYAPGSTGTLYYDDPPNLSGLTAISDGQSALAFTLSGEAGPLGRPLALATFALQHSAWPDQLPVMLWTNIFIHLLNGLLVAWLAIKLARVSGLQSPHAAWLAVLTASIWILMPLLASSSLILVQRMTTLSASFVMLGLIGFMQSRQMLEEAPKRALWGMSASLLVFTALAALTKENGALLPLFALIISATFMPAPGVHVHRAWHWWSLLFLWLPLVGLLMLFAAYVPYSESTAFLRDFTAWERLLTQTKILWQYLFHAFVPTDTAFFGPFHDNRGVSRSLWEPLTLLAVGSWIAVLGLAIWIRRKSPIVTFAVFWYLGGHILESTVLPLELYFEHRNYVPLIGPIFALGWLIVHVPVRYRLTTSFGATIYIGLLAITLWVITSQWGNPLKSAEQQLINNRDSARAVAHYTKQLLSRDMVDPVIKLLDQTIEKDIKPERLLAGKIYFRCQFRPEEEANEWVEELIDRLPEAGPDRNLSSALYSLIDLGAQDNCRAISPEDGAAIVEALAQHPDYGFRKSYWHHLSLARMAEAAGDTGQRKQHLELATRQRFRFEPVQELVELHIEEKKYDSACNLIGDIWKEHSADYKPRRLGIHLKLRQLAQEIHDASNDRPCYL